MKRIGVLSDTHGTLHTGVVQFLLETDEIWHAGDIGSLDIYDRITALKPLRAVYGNIDDHLIRMTCPESLVFNTEEVKVALIHIGGFPGRYERRAMELIQRERPTLFVCGHSHILKVMYDRKNELLTVNPGAAGNFGFHQSITAVRFLIDGKDIRDMEILDIPRK